MQKQKGFIPTLLVIIGSIALAYASARFIDNQQRLGAIPSGVAFFETSLASKMSSTETSTATLVSGLTKDGTYLDGTYGFVIDEGTASEEVIIATASSTALTSIKRGISAVDGTTTIAALQYEHRRGATVKMTNAPSQMRLIRTLNGQEPVEAKIYYNATKTISNAYDIPDKNYVDTRDALYLPLAGGTVTGAVTFNEIPTLDAYEIPTTDAQLAAKKYVDDVAIAGSPTMTTSTKGIAKLSIDPVSSTNPIVWGYNDDGVHKDFIFSEFTAGEALVANDAIAIAHKDNCIIYTTTTQQMNGEEAQNYTYVYQSFVSPTGTPKFYGFSVLTKGEGGSETFNVYLTTSTTTTAPIFNCSYSLSEGQVESSGVKSACSTSTGITLNNSSTYYIISKRDSTRGRWYATTTSGYSGGLMAYSTDGISWTTTSSKDLVFQVYYLTGTANQAYKSGKIKYITSQSVDGAVRTLKEDADCRYNFIGFSSSTYSAGDTAKIKTAGIISGFSGLATTNLNFSKVYNVNASSTDLTKLGKVATGTLSTAYEVGYAINSSTILINNKDTGD